MRTKQSPLMTRPKLLLLAACLCLTCACHTDRLPGMDNPGPDDDTAATTSPQDFVGRPVCFGQMTVTQVAVDAATRAATRTTETPFGQTGDIITIGMTVTPAPTDAGATPTTIYADYTCAANGTWAPLADPLYWVDVTSQHTFVAYFPALTDEEKADGRTAISLPLAWTEELYHKYGNYMTSLVQTPIGATVSFSLSPLLTRIEVKMKDDAATFARLLSIFTKAQGEIITAPGTGSATPTADAPVQEMKLWRTTVAAASDPSAPTLYCGYTLPQTYAQGSMILVHYDVGVPGAKTYTVDNAPLTTLPGTIVSFTVDAIVGVTLGVQAGGLKNALDNYAADNGDRLPSRLKITGSLNKDDIIALATAPGISTVDMEDASAEADAFGTGASSSTEPPFSNYEGSIKSLILPKGLNTLPDDAFYYSTLESITLPEGLTTIGQSAFYNCRALTHITIPSSVTTWGRDAFANSGLTSVMLSAGLTTIGESAFEDCYALTHITIPSSVTTWGSDAFSGSGLTSVTLTAGLTTIGESAFEECEDLTHITIPSSVTSWGRSAFSGSGLISVTLSAGLTTIGERAFMDCYALTHITIPSSVTTWGHSAFSSSGLTSVTLSAGLTTIGEGAFMDCFDLKQVALSGDKPIEVGADAFEYTRDDIQLFLYSPELTENDERIAGFTGGNWGTWANTHWGYKGTGSKIDAANYSYHRPATP